MSVEPKHPGPRRHPRRTEKARNGTPENERTSVQVKLRLSPDHALRLRGIAAAEEIDVSALVARWIDEAK